MKKHHATIDFIFQIILMLNAFVVCTALLLHADPWPWILLYWSITGVRNTFNLYRSKKHPERPQPPLPGEPGENT